MRKFRNRRQRLPHFCLTSEWGISPCLIQTTCYKTNVFISNVGLTSVLLQICRVCFVYKVFLDKVYSMFGFRILCTLCSAWMLLLVFRIQCILTTLYSRYSTRICPGFSIVLSTCVLDKVCMCWIHWVSGSVCSWFSLFWIQFVYGSVCPGFCVSWIQCVLYSVCTVHNSLCPGFSVSWI